MGKLFLTADLHLGHANIIKYCNRPFKDVVDMNETIIRKWNERVKEEDTVIHVGDFCFRNSGEERGEGLRTKSWEYIKKLNGQKVFIRGNHDKNNSLSTHIESLILKWGGNFYWVTHRPENMNRGYAINFVGHVHEHWKFKKDNYLGSWDAAPSVERFLINVGIDVCNFYPCTIEEHLSKFHYWRKHVQT